MLGRTPANITAIRPMKEGDRRLHGDRKDAAVLHPQGTSHA